jgi:hypothetical protein
MTARAVATRAGLLACVCAMLGLLSVREPAYAIAFTSCVCVVAIGASLRHGWAILALASLAAVAVLVSQASQGNIASAWKLGGHVALIPGVLLLWYYSREIPPRIRKGAAVGLAFVALSAIAGLLGGPGPLSDAIGAIWQEGRWIGAVGVGYAIARSVGPATRRWTFAWLFAIDAVNLLVSVFQLRGSQTETRFGIPEVPGVFGHPTPSSVAGLALLLFVIIERDRLTGRERIVAGVVAALDLILSVRLKTVVGLGAGLALLVAMRVGVRPRPLALASAILPVAVTFALVAFTPTAGNYHVGSTTGLANVYEHATTRITLFQSAERLAADNLPVGAGLATFGSYLDSRREFATFSRLGLVGSYGFQHHLTLVSDNYDAHILAERGYAGLVAWLLSVAAFLWCALVAPAPFRSFPVVIIAAAVAMSPFLPVFRGGGEIIVLFVPVGMYLWGATEASAGSLRRAIGRAE